MNKPLGIAVLIFVALTMVYLYKKT